MANEIMICTCRVRAGAEQRFAELLGSHWRTLRGLGFVTGEPPLLEERDGRPKWEFPHFERVAVGA
jgi:hypothetical protein